LLRVQSASRIAAGLADFTWHSLRSGATFVLFAALLSSTAFAQTHPTGSERIFHDLILERINAYGRGDVATYMRMLSDEFVHVSDRGERRTKNQLRAFVRNGANHASYRVSELHWRLEGELAIVDAVIHESLPFMTVGLRETDLFVWRRGRWLYLQHQESPILQPAIAVAVRGERLADYAGRYRAATGTIDDITMRNGVLYDRMEPGDMAPLILVGRGAFGFQDDPTLAVFLRDAAGKVTDCLWHLPNGKAIVSHRI